jgi:DNA-binding transcriptional LysR family regulator
MIATVLGPRLAPLLTRHSALSIDLVAEARHLNLFRREADIAIRPSRFPQLDIIQRQVAVLGFGLYASDDYVARLGVPDFSAGARGHSLVLAGAEMGKTIVDTTWLPALFGALRVAARANSRLAMANLAAAGAGIACLPCYLGNVTPGLRRIPTPTRGPGRQLWLGTHRDARKVRRVKVVVDFIAEVFARLRSALDPGD